MHESRVRVGRTHPSRTRGIVIFYPAEFVFVCSFARPPAGLIPAELGKLAALEYLTLAGNELSGESHNAVQGTEKLSREI